MDTKTNKLLFFFKDVWSLWKVWRIQFKFFPNERLQNKKTFPISIVLYSLVYFSLWFQQGVQPLRLRAFLVLFYYLPNCHWDPGTVKSQISELLLPAIFKPPAVTIKGLPKWALLWYIPHPKLSLSWFMEGPLVILKLLLASNSQTVDTWSWSWLLKCQIWNL